MSHKAKEYRRKAVEAEAHASRWESGHIQDAYLAVARKWRAMAEQAERMDDR